MLKNTAITMFFAIFIRLASAGEMNREIGETRERERERESERERERERESLDSKRSESAD